MFVRSPMVTIGTSSGCTHGTSWMIFEVSDGMLSPFCGRHLFGNRKRLSWSGTSTVFVGDDILHANDWVFEKSMPLIDEFLIIIHTTGLTKVVLTTPW